MIAAKKKEEELLVLDDKIETAEVDVQNESSEISKERNENDSNESLV